MLLWESRDKKPEITYHNEDRNYSYRMGGLVCLFVWNCSEFWAVPFGELEQEVGIDQRELVDCGSGWEAGVVFEGVQDEECSGFEDFFIAERIGESEERECDAGGVASGEVEVGEWRSELCFAGGIGFEQIQDGAHSLREVFEGVGGWAALVVAC